MGGIIIAISIYNLIYGYVMDKDLNNIDHKKLRRHKQNFTDGCLGVFQLAILAIIEIIIKVLLFKSLLYLREVDIIPDWLGVILGLTVLISFLRFFIIRKIMGYSLFGFDD